MKTKKEEPKKTGPSKEFLQRFALAAEDKIIEKIVSEFVSQVSFEELRDFLDMLIQKTFPIVRIITFQEPKPLLLALIAFSISVLFIFIKPFWFNIIFVTLALTLPGVLLLPPVNGALFAGAEKVKTE